MSIAARRRVSPASAPEIQSEPIESATPAWRTVRPRWVVSTAVGLAAILAATALVLGVNPSSSFATEAHDDQIVRLYVTALGRTPDAQGLAYWSDRRENGETMVDLAREMISLPEAQAVSSGDFVVDAYRNVLDRDPEPGGYEHWASFNDPAVAVAQIADSPEAQALTGTTAPPIPLVEVSPAPAAATNVPTGWVDSGNGVFLPPILLEIRFCESTDNYTAANSRSSARGAYQFLSSSWAWYGHAARYGVSSADQATPAQQDEAALLTWQQDGTRPWYASRHCWG